MSFYTIERAKTIIKRDQIRITHMNYDRPFFVFKIQIDDEPEVTVSKSERGWLCDGYESKKAFQARTYEAIRKGWKLPTEPWRCTGNKDKPDCNCVHILASKILVKDESLGKDGDRYSFLRKEFLARQVRPIPSPIITEERA